MLHVRLVVPPDLTPRVQDIIDAEPSIVDIVFHRDGALRPRGDVIVFDLPVEAANDVLGALRRIGVPERGSIVVDRVDMVLSETAEAAIVASPGDPSEAVIWEEVKARVAQDSELTPTWLILLVIAVLIAGIGVLTDSAVLIVGAMVVGPEYGPVASIAVGLHLERWSWVRRGVADLAIGFGLAIPLAALLAWIVELAGVTPAAFVEGASPATRFITQPDGFAAVVALLAGIAGTLSLTLARAGTLVGVLISVTTVPAASAIGVNAAHGRWADAGGATVQLLLNLVILAMAGAATLRVQRRVHLARRRPLDAT